MSAPSKASAASEPAVIVGPPAAPLASRRHVSFVEVSPSTVTQLKVLSVTRESAGCRSAASTGASVVRNASSVAMSGWIIPAPFAMPPTV